MKRTYQVTNITNRVGGFYGAMRHSAVAWPLAMVALSYQSYGELFHSRRASLCRSTVLFAMRSIDLEV
ncbi:hypothetical protein RSP822_09030 [Ralstonia solanacearum]|nr:hypothetical protein RSP822_09030 [Ralstonia solanacearum]